ncbi:Gfo/Idh/MocA family oxidoreductase [Dactylosporangium sp. AC04546]|uniref:Gfo/Idh/MocA family protein n=1 Tax=Dactylosporangium sp. AC04546 TaxID=2862460 RepID=UPI001EE0FCAF|nr:Gfo/Idh/MocA family oxidoreductase [Dactylosporangium sp. AC04546]WVK79043.1 Gfo/Idh/MocA family oxidoreductase [Dactylosporangium sp. AC04546]
MSLRMAVLGLADIALRRIVPAMSRTPGVRLTVVASRDPARATAVARTLGVRAAPDYRAALEDPEVDAVYLPLPPAVRAPWVAAALAAGRHVLAEKPLTADRHQTAELAATAAARGLVLAENYMFVHHAMHRQVAALVAHRLGRLRAFEAAFAIPARPAGDIRLRPELGGGALLDVGGYPLRAARYFLGDELGVAGAALWRDPALGVDLGGAALLTRPDGVTAQVSFGLAHQYVSRYALVGDGGRLSVEHVFTPGPGVRGTAELACGGDRRTVRLVADDHAANRLAAFATAVRAGPALAADGADGADAVRQADLVAAVAALA